MVDKSLDSGTKALKIVRLREGKSRKSQDVVVKERPVSIFLNDDHIATSMCTPNSLEYMAVGYLLTEGLIHGKSDVKSVVADEKACGVWVETSRKVKPPRNPEGPRLLTAGCGSSMVRAGKKIVTGQSKMNRRITISEDFIRTLVLEFQRRSVVYRLTGGVHGAALCDSEGIRVFNEDIGRHNAVDKVIGECLLREISMRDKIMVTSGRITSEMLAKVAISGIPIIISKSAPTDLAVDLAIRQGVTLVGFVRGKRMNVYSNGQRIKKANRSASPSFPR